MGEMIQSVLRKEFSRRKNESRSLEMFSKGQSVANLGVNWGKAVVSVNFTKPKSLESTWI